MSRMTICGIGGEVSAKDKAMTVRTIGHAETWAEAKHVAKSKTDKEYVGVYDSTGRALVFWK